MAEQYNPLDKINLGKSVAEALLDRQLDSLGGLQPFQGAGIYVIYYMGLEPPYHAMGNRNRNRADWPIYIGKAIPSGSRRGAAVSSEITGRVLFNRLRDHADSIIAARNLEIDDFKCRYLIVDDIWIPLGESLLIAKFKPVWNHVLDGFGNHDPGAGRYNGLRPLWDVLHPGRIWADRCQQRRETPEDLAQRVSDFLGANTPPEDPHINFAPPNR